MWAYLPDLLLEQIFGYLTMRQKYYCAQVCRNWLVSFMSPRIWRKLRVSELSFTERRFNLYKGYQYEVSPYRVQMYLGCVGNYLHKITIEPISNFYNLYEFMNVLSSFFEFFDDYPMPQLHTVEFSFYCEMRTLTGSIILGTGGKLLDELKRLLNLLKNLRSLKLNNLLLDNRDVVGLLEGVVDHCRDTMTHLEVLNSTKIRHPLFPVAMFPRLKTLVISPLQLTGDVVMMLARNTQLVSLVIIQDKYTNEAEAISSHVWWEVKQIAPKLRVSLQVRGCTEAPLLIQENAPVYSVIYTTPYAIISPATLIEVADLYRPSLEVYAHTGLPRKHGSRSFHDRGDSCLVLLVRQCRRLHTLIIRERVSTATLLLLATEGRQLRALHVRQNAVLLRSDWPCPADWTLTQYTWLTETARSYTSTEREVSRLLDQPWHMLSDQEFKEIKLKHY